MPELGPVFKSFIDLIGHGVGKIIALSGVAALTAMVAYFQAEPSASIIAVALVGSVVVWQKGVVPFVNELIANVKPKSTAVRATGTSVKDYLSFGNW